uniref:Acyl-CoA-binding domain-containing protein 6 n=1 Tax=Xenopsylla cheopis TaxID=163159 RepID=A0A6M2DRH2_XENCH
MAECGSKVSDSDDDESNVNSDLVNRFNWAATFLSDNAHNMDSSVLLQLYALYKQATVGCCNIPKPSWFRTQDKMKWEAWSSLKDMPKEIAMEKYIYLISTINKTWNASGSTSKAKSQSWITVSTFSSGDSATNEAKNIFDFCKDGDLYQVSLLLEGTTKDLLDNQGLGLLHWAADRGYLQIIKLLLINGYDVNLLDAEGQTALHYAVSCSHKECIKYLLERGIDFNIKDDDGKLARDLTDDVEILKLLDMFFAE